MQVVLLPDAGAGVAPVDLAGRIPVAGGEAPVFHQDRPEGKSIQYPLAVDQAGDLSFCRLLQDGKITVLIDQQAAEPEIRRAVLFVIRIHLNG